MDSIYLSGSEEVSRAGRLISSAADNMRSAAINIDGSVDRMQRILDDFLFRLEHILKKENNDG